MSKQRIAELEAEIAELRARIAALEARPMYPIVVPPNTPPDQTFPWPNRIIYTSGTKYSYGAAPYTINAVAS